jgi:hypothetical protein
MDDATLDERLAELAEQLTATAERPVETTASRWLGEAEAVAADLADGAVDREVVAERIGHVRRLLSEVETTGDETADDHVETARDIAARIETAVVERPEE